MRLGPRFLALLATGLLLVGLPTRALAAPGDPVVVADDTQGTPGNFFKAIDRIRPDGTAEQITPGNAIPVGTALAFTGADSGVMVGLGTIGRFTLSSGQLIVVPAAGAGDLRGVATNSSGSVLATDLGPSNGTASDGRVLALNVSSGAVNQISSGGLLRNPLGIAVAEDGAIFVTNADGNGQGQVVEVDPDGGQRLVSSGPLVAPWGLGFLPEGDLVLADESYNHAFRGALVRVDPATGMQTARFLESLSGPIDNATGVAVAENGEVLVSERNSGQVDRVDLATGAARELGHGAPSPLGVAVEPGVGPSTTLTGGPIVSTQDTTPEFTFTPSRYGAESSCRVDGDPAVPCHRAFTSPALGVGPHTFTVASTIFGAQGPLATREFAVDPAAPLTLIDSGPSGLTNEATPTFVFEAPGAGTSFLCRIDGGGALPCQSPFTTPGLADGPHSFNARANNDPTGDTRNFTVDATPPPTSITSGPTEGAATANPQPTFTFGSTETSTFLCSLDSVRAPCTSSFTPAAALAEGAHTLTVIAVDVAGNHDPAPLTRHFSIDTTPPVTTITGGPIGTTGDDTPTFTFSASEAGVFFECSIDSLTLSACASPFTPPALSNAAHTFRVKATDAAGNPDAAIRQRDFTVDATLPDTTFTLTPRPLSNDPEPDFAFVSDKPDSTFLCGFENTVPFVCQSPQHFAPLREGIYTWVVTAVDALGHPDPTPAKFTFEIDLNPPQTTLSEGPAALTNDSTPEFKFSSEPGTAFVCQFDGGLADPCTSPFVPPTLSEGAHTLAVIATDEAGNPDPDPPHYEFTVDSVAPDAKIDAGPTGETTDTRPIFAVSASEKATLKCSFDGGAASPCGPSVQAAAPFGFGSHMLTVTATDPAGNADATPARREFVVVPVRAATRLTLRGSIRKGKLSIKASLSPPASGSVALTVTGRGSHKRLHKRLVLKIRAGTGSASLRLPLGIERVQLRASYAGDKEHLPASRTLKVRAHVH